MSRWLLRRELTLVFGARATWLVLGISALLIGHGFVLAVDLFSAASRSALGHALMRREMDPLAGVIRPTLGGLHLSVALLLPIVAARGLAIEKERRSFGALCLRARGSDPVVVTKWLVALLCGLVLLLPPLLLFGLFMAMGGHVYAPELCVALTGHALHVALIATTSVAAAAATQTAAQAMTLGVLVSLSSWAIDASEGFAALAWMGSFEWASVGARLDPFEEGVVSIGSLAWFVTLVAAMTAVALLLARYDSPARQLTRTLLVVAIAAPLLYAFGHVQRGYDLTEQARMSLPPAAVEALRADGQPIHVELWLDRDDGRRAQVERDALAKLLLARPDVVVTTPLDDASSAHEALRDDAYGRIVIRVGRNVRETRSTSRRELHVLLFEAMGRPFPSWKQSSYSGYPLVVEGTARTTLVMVVYLVLPCLHLLCGLALTRTRRRTP